MAAAKHYGVILMDIKMPVMDGIDALEQIKAIDPQTKVIFVSGHAKGDWPQAVLRDGVHAVLAKPVEPEKLLALIHSLTKNQSAGA